MRSFDGFLKYNTNATICLGPFVDKTDDITPISGLASGMDGASGVKLSKNGGALAIRLVTGLASTAYDTDGFYRFTLQSGDVNALGNLAIEYTLPATIRPVCQSYAVLPANIYDSLVAGTDFIQADAVEINSNASGASGLNDFAVAGYTPSTHKVNEVILVDTSTNLTNAPTAGDLTSTMKASVTTAAASATPVVASVTNPVTVSGDLSATMKTSVEAAVRKQIDSAVSGTAATGSVGKLAVDYLDAAISSRLGPTGVLTTVTNLTNAPTSGDFTSTMKTSLVSGVNFASGMVVASVSGSVGSVVNKTGFSLSSSGLDAVAAPADLANDTAARGTFMGMFRAMFNRFYNKVTQSNTQQIVFNDGATGVSTMPVQVVGGVETKGQSS